MIDQDPLAFPAQSVTSDGATSLVFTGGTYTTAAISITSAPRWRKMWLARPSPQGMSTTVLPVRSGNAA